MAPKKTSRPDLSKRARGRWGENLATAQYRRAGYQIVDRNWRCTHGEIDLIARRGNTVVFCEVKARRSDAYGTAAEAVDLRKQLRLRRLAATWLAEHHVRQVEVRFDVVAINGVRLEVVEAAF